MNYRINKDNALQVAALRDGTVIDHIPSDKLFSVVAILGIENESNKVTIGNNLLSKKLGLKGIIKIADRFFDDDEINQIALVAPDSRLNVIRNYEVVDKRQVRLPDNFQGICRCANPKCITNNEPMLTCFHVLGEDRKILKCHYCEKQMSRDEVSLL